MQALPRLGLLVVVLLIASLRLRGSENVVLCADEWMPFNGEAASERPGYVIELVKAVFEPEGVAVDYVVRPWEQALEDVRQGRMTAVIGANLNEAEGMVVPSEPIGTVPTCLLVLADSTWNYENVVSFRSVKLGVIKDYCYWPNLDDYIARKAGSAVVVVEGEAPLADLLGLLVERKVDVIAETEPVLLWHLRANNIDRSRFRVVYKHEAEAIYLAFAPNDAGRRFASRFDAGVKALRASGALEKLLRRYGLRDWQ